MDTSDTRKSLRQRWEGNVPRVQTQVPNSYLRVRYQYYRPSLHVFGEIRYSSLFKELRRPLRRRSEKSLVKDLLGERGSFRTSGSSVTIGKYWYSSSIEILFRLWHLSTRFTVFFHPGTTVKTRLFSPVGTSEGTVI